MDAVGTITEQVTEISDRLGELARTVAVMPAPRSTDALPFETDDRLRELLVGLEQARNAVEAAQAASMVAMGDEARRLDAAEFAVTGLPARSNEEFVPDEVSVLLRCTKVAASHRYGAAVTAQRHSALRDGWQSGRIDERKVTAIADELAPLEPGTAVDALAAAAVDHATQHSASQTREWLRRRVIAIDPETADRRRKDARRTRRVVITPAADGMSELWAWLPSLDARAIQQALTQAAHELGSADPRSMDERRADLLVEWLLGDSCAPLVEVPVLVPVGGGDQHGWVPGVGPITADQLCEHRPTKAVDRAVRLRDVTCRFPGCRRPAIGAHTGTDLDHTVPWPHGLTTPDNLAVLCRRHHRLKHSPGWSVVLHPDGTMTWRTPSGRRYESEPWEYVDPTDGPDPPSHPLLE